ncbi:MAG: glyoxylate/hydroxypyruvate reductase A [Pseudomonadota bacterium]
MHILVSMPTEQRDHAERWRTALMQRLPSADISVYSSGEVPRNVDYVVTWKPDADLMSRLTGLRAVFTASAGVDAILAQADLPDCPIVRLLDAGMGDQMADYALFAGLYLQRGFDRMREAQAEARWAPALGAARDRPVVGILGLGTLGSVVAARLVANGFPVRGWSRTARTVPELSCFHGLDGLDDFLAGTELLFCLLPLTPQTRHLIDRRRLEALPRGAAVVNVARGPVVNEVDLLAALDSGHVRCALLDVFATEPLPPDNPLWQHPRVVITPHVAAATLIEPSADSVVADMARLERGDTPRGLVDRARGY